MSTLGFFHGAMPQNFLVWAMPLAHQPIKVWSLLAQVQLCGEAQAEEERQVHGAGWPCPLGTLPPAAAEPGWLPGSFASKASRIFSRGHLVTYSWGRQKAGCRSRSFTGKDGGPAGRRKPRSPAAARTEPGRSWVACREGKMGVLWSERSGRGAMLSLGWKPLSAHHQLQPHIRFISQRTRLSDPPSVLVTVASDGGWEGCWPFEVKSSFPLLLRQMQLEPSAERGTE